MDYGALSENSKNKIYDNIQQKLNQLQSDDVVVVVEGDSSATTSSTVDTNKHIGKALANIPIDFSVDVDSRGQIALTCLDCEMEEPNEPKKSPFIGLNYRSNFGRKSMIVKTSISKKELNAIL